MRLFPILTSCLLLAAPLAAAPAIKGETKYKRDSLVKLTADGVDGKAGLRWRVYPSGVVQRATNPRGVFEFAAAPGTYEVELLAITVGDEGAVSIDEASVTVTVEGSGGTTPPPPPPGGGRLDPANALGRIQFGNAGCTATVVYPRRPDGRWDVLSAAHCITGVGQRGTMKMPATGKVYNVTVTALNKAADIAWLATDASIEDIEYAHLARANPAVNTPVWHQGYGVDQPRNREEGWVRAAENNSGQLSFVLNVSSGDSGGGIFRADTNELVSSVCCTSGDITNGTKAAMWGGSCRLAWLLRPAAKADNTSGAAEPTQDNWTPLPLPSCPNKSAREESPQQPTWTPLPMPIRTEPASEPRQPEWTPVPLPVRPASLSLPCPAPSYQWPQGVK